MNFMEDGKREAEMVCVAYFKDFWTQGSCAVRDIKNRSLLPMKIPSGVKLGPLDVSSPTTLLDSCYSTPGLVFVCPLVGQGGCARCRDWLCLRSFNLCLALS